VLPADLPSFADLRERLSGNAQVSAVLDEVLYGPTGDTTGNVDVGRDVRRDIVEAALRIVSQAAAVESAILAGPADCHGDDLGSWGDWSGRFAQLAGSVDPAGPGARFCGEIVAQCAQAPPGLDKLVGVLAATAAAPGWAGSALIDPLADSAQRLETVRSELIDAGCFADIAWCAAHGMLTDCPSWRLQLTDASEQDVLTRLRRFLPVKATRPAATHPTGLRRGSAGSSSGADQVPLRLEGETFSVPITIIKLLDKLLRDGRWPTAGQRDVASQVRSVLDSASVKTQRHPK
jgi:hypothetical protein